jgi:Cellulose binding domain
MRSAIIVLALARAGPELHYGEFVQGARVSVRNLAWNRWIDPGRSVTFGFVCACG